MLKKQNFELGEKSTVSFMQLYGFRKMKINSRISVIFTQIYKNFRKIQLQIILKSGIHYFSCCLKFF